jgi:cytochrome c-type biogenesis protein CcmH
MGRYADAAAAMGNVIDRADAASSVLSQYAEALVAAENGIVTPKARGALRRARELDPSNPAAAYYEAIALDQEGDRGKAHDLLLARLNAATGPAPWMDAFIAQANRIGEMIGRDPVGHSALAPMLDDIAPGPSADDVAAAADLSETDRTAFIRSMVERLAKRLNDTPEDLDGWMRLANAYSVLGELENSRNAYRTAARLAESLPTEDPRRQTIRQAQSELEG